MNTRLPIFPLSLKNLNAFITLTCIARPGVFWTEMIFMNFKIDLAASRNVNISKFIPVVFISREIQDERLVLASFPRMSDTT